MKERDAPGQETPQGATGRHLPPPSSNQTRIRISASHAAALLGRLAACSAHSCLRPPAACAAEQPLRCWLPHPPASRGGRTCGTLHANPAPTAPQGHFSMHCVGTTAHLAQGSFWSALHTVVNPTRPRHHLHASVCVRAPGIACPDKHGIALALPPPIASHLLTAAWHRMRLPAPSLPGPDMPWRPPAMRMRAPAFSLPRLGDHQGAD